MCSLLLGFADIASPHFASMLLEQSCLFSRACFLGTGKTATFAVSILQKIDISLAECQALVLAPTRELAQQIVKVVRALGDFMQLQVIKQTKNYSCVALVQLRNTKKSLSCLACSHISVVRNRCLALYDSREGYFLWRHGLYMVTSCCSGWLMTVSLRRTL